MSARGPGGGLAAVVLAAGAGTRLRPLTCYRPKALCPVNNVPLVDLAIDQARRATDHVAVNVHHGRDQLEPHLAGRVHVSVEEGDEAFGTAGALRHLRTWIQGRSVLVLNADAWRRDGLDDFLAGWDGERIRLLAVHDPERGDFGPWRYAGAALMPWSDIEPLSPEPSGLYEASWARAEAEGRVDLVACGGDFIDCGTPGDYLAANLAASGGHSVIGEGAVVDGEVVRSVIWPQARVSAGERLVESIRVGSDVTVSPWA